MASPVPNPVAAPVAEASRIDAIDVLRGVAVLGILVLNIQAFSMPGAAYFNPTAYGDLEGANLYVWVAGRMLADQKFMTIFSMLFGASIVLMTERAEARGDAPRVHYCRMGWLLVIGLLHAHLDLSMHQNLRYYLVGPEATADEPMTAAFREWVSSEAGGLAVPAAQ